MGFPLGACTTRKIICEAVGKAVDCGDVLANHEASGFKVDAECEIIEVCRENAAVAGEDVASLRRDGYGVVQLCASFFVPLLSVDDRVVDKHENDAARYGDYA